MNWRNPEKELPKQGQIVWVMLEPHKWRGSFLKSAMSIQIVCGETSYSNDQTTCRVENGDELGQGSISWYFKNKTPENFYFDEAVAIAWVSVDEMNFPE